MAAHLGIHPLTLVRWAEHGLVTRHAYNGHAYLYDKPGANPPAKHSSRWDRLTDRVAVRATQTSQDQQAPIEPKEVQYEDG